MRAVGIVPARWASSRFPGKPLVPVAGVPMIQRTWQAACTAKSLRDVLVATDDLRIAETCRRVGAPVVMTRDDHSSGTDRLGEVAERLDDDIIVNIQGDEPLIEGFVIDAAVEALLRDPTASLATVVHPVDETERNDRNRVKAHVDDAGHAIAFSRSALGVSDGEVFQHVGLYAYRRDALLELVTFEPTPAEREHQLEQLRALEHGFVIAAAVVDGWRSTPVDVQEDVARAEAALTAHTGA